MRLRKSATETAAISAVVRHALLAVARGERVGTTDDAVLRAAAAEGLIGLLAEAAANPWRELKIRAVAVEAESVRFARELSRISACFAEAALPLLAWKGLVASQQLYGKPWLRTFGDLDLVVAGAEAERAEGLLRRLGYDEVVPVAPAARGTQRRFEPAALFSHHETQMLVDLHWRFSNPRFPLRLSFEEVWQRHELVRIDDFEVPAPGRVDLVVLTCSHAAKHLWHRLEMLAQIAALGRQTLDWVAVDEAAQRAGASRQVGLSFLLAREVLGAELPPLPLSLARAEGSLAQVSPIVASNLFSTLARKHDATGSELFFLLDRRSDVLRAVTIAALVPTYGDWQGSRLPAALQWIRRPMKLLWNRARGRAS